VAQLDERGRHAAASSDIPDGYQDIYDSPEFAELRSRFRRLVIPLVVGFLAWYTLYVFTATYAHKFMKHEVWGHINRGLLFGLLEFVSTFGIAYLYSVRAEKEIDPLAAELLERFNSRAGGE
jgi:uncharacterized membrane protein (DUF485 family)